MYELPSYKIYLIVLLSISTFIIFLISCAYIGLKKNFIKNGRLISVVAYVKKGIHIFLFKDLKMFVFLSLFFSFLISFYPKGAFKMVLSFILGVMSTIYVIFFCVKYTHLASLKVLKYFNDANNSKATSRLYCHLLTIGLFIIAVSVVGIIIVLLISDSVKNNLISYTSGVVMVGFIFNFRGVFYKKLDLFFPFDRARKNYFNNPVYYSYLINIICCQPTVMFSYMFIIIVFATITPIFIATLLKTSVIINLSNIIDISTNALILLPLTLSSTSLISISITLILVYILKEYKLSSLLSSYVFVNVIVTLCLYFIIILGFGVTIKVYWIMLSGICAFTLICSIGFYYNIYPNSSNLFFHPFPHNKTFLINKSISHNNEHKTISEKKITINGLKTMPFFAVIICAYVILSNYLAGVYGVGMSLVVYFMLIGLMFFPLKYNVIDRYLNELCKFLRYSLFKPSLVPYNKLNAKKSDIIFMNVNNLLFILISLVLFFACYMFFREKTLEIFNMKFLAGSIFGIFIPFFTCFLIYSGPKDNVFSFFKEVDQQFKENMEFSKKSDILKYHLGFCIDLLMDSSLKKLVLFFIISIIIPVFISFAVGNFVLLGMIFGVFLSASMILILITNVYSVWDELNYSLKETIPSIIQIQTLMIFLVSLIFIPLGLNIWG